MALWRDELQHLAALLDARPSAEVAAAREVIVRAVEHARTCTACFPDPNLIADLDALLDVTGDEQLDAAAVDIAVELNHRLTTHQMQPSAGAPTCGNTAASHGIAPAATPQSQEGPSR